MPRTLSQGSTGNDVVELQRNLNQLPSKQLPLKPDGQFGGKTRTRVVEVQSSSSLKADGVVGPLTWNKMIELLQKIGDGGVIPIVPGLPPQVFAELRPLVMMIAQQSMGKVDFSILIGGRPKGIDFLIDIFRVAAQVNLTDENFHPWKEVTDKNGIKRIELDRTTWVWTPWIAPSKKGNNWCGIFAAYCYRKSGIPVNWNLGAGKPVGRIRMAKFGPNFVDEICMADIGCVNTKSHHFLIETVTKAGRSASITSIDGNGLYGRIERTTKHRVGTDNFSYYGLNMDPTPIWK